MTEAQKSFEVSSPDENIKIYIRTGEKTTWSVKHGKTIVLLASEVGIQLSDERILGRNTGDVSEKRASANTLFETPFYKKHKFMTIIIR